FQRKDCFAGFVHRRNRLLETHRGCGGAKVTTVIYEDRYAGRHRHAENSGDKSVLVSWSGADANPGEITSHTSVADIDIVAAGGEIEAGVKAQRDVAGAGSVTLERSKTDGRVVAGGCIVIERIKTDCGVVFADGVAKKRIGPIGRMTAAGSIGIERV